jgi:hypothetical protein
MENIPKRYRPTLVDTTGRCLVQIGDFEGDHDALMTDAMETLEDPPTAVTMSARRPKVYPHRASIHLDPAAILEEQRAKAKAEAKKKKARKQKTELGSDDEDEDEDEDEVEVEVAKAKKRPGKKRPREADSDNGNDTDKPNKKAKKGKAASPRSRPKLSPSSA